MRTFFKSLSISFSGSMPMGIMNMAALQVSLKQGTFQAIGFAVAAIGLEGFVMYGTGYLGETLMSRPKWLRSINVVSAFLLFGIGILFFYKVWALSHITQVAQMPDLPGWQYGIWLRLLNPTAILFWLGVHLALADGQIVRQSHCRLMTFAVGGMTGTLGAYCVYIFLAHQLNQYLQPLSNKINLILGALCLLAAVYKWREKAPISELP